MKTKVSAGGVIVKKLGNIYRVLLLRDMNNSWTFPKGLVEKGETNKAAAIREIGEEVGLTKLDRIGSISSIKYMYRRGGFIQKTVHYFLFRTKGDEKIACQKNEGIKEAKWFGFDKALRIVGYSKTNVLLLKKAQKLL